MSPRQVTICQRIFWVQQLTEPTGTRYVCSLSYLNYVACAPIAFVWQRWFDLCEKHHLFQSGSHPLRCPVGSPDKAGKLFPERTSSSAHMRVLAYRREFQAATERPTLCCLPVFHLGFVLGSLAEPVKWFPLGGSNDWGFGFRTWPFGDLCKRMDGK